MGDGRNSVFLAKNGWKVTGIDISSQGVGLAVRRALQNKVTIDARVLDINEFKLERGTWDLILLFYVEPLLHLQTIGIQNSLTKDGYLMVEYATGADSIGGETVIARFEKMFPLLVIRFFQDLPGSSDWSANLTEQRIIRFIGQRRAS
jgi:hypothetical protein